MYATTRQFLDYFNLDSLEQLPPLSEIRDLEEINRGLSLEEDKPVGRIIEFPDPGEGEQELVVDEEAEKAAEIGLRPISEILSLVDSQLGIAPAADEADSMQEASAEVSQEEAALAFSEDNSVGQDAAQPEDGAHGDPESDRSQG